MDARAQAQLLLAIVTVALASAMLLRPARSRLFTHFAVLCANLCAWSLSHFLARILPESLVPERMAIAAEAMLPATALTFVLEFLGDPGSKARRTRRSCIAAGIVGSGLALTQLVSMKPAGWLLSPLRLATATYCFLMLGTAASLIYARMRRSVSRTERARLMYLLVGAVLALGLTAIQVAAGHLPVPPVGTIAVTVYVYFLWQTLLRHRLLDLNELLGKLIVLSLLALLLAAIYGLLVAWSVNASQTGVRWAGLFLFNTLVASFVILILFDPLKSRIEGAVVSLLFGERRAFLTLLQQLRARVASCIDVDELAQRVLDTLHDSRRVTHASLYLLGDDGLGFRRLAFRGPPPAPFLDAATARALVGTAAQGQRAVLVENVERRLFELRSLLPGASSRTLPPLPASTQAGDEATLLSEMGAALAALHAGVCLPLVGGDRVLGFLNLQDDRVSEAFTTEEIAEMISLAEQLAVTVENSRHYARMKERDRLATLGEMAAGLAHEIRNPLSSIKGAVQYLDPAALPGSDGELLGVIVEEVDRLNKVVTQFLDYSRPVKARFQPQAINDLLERTLRLLSGRELPETLEVRTDLEPGLPELLCDADQLKQVVINLVLNAVQAMPNGGTLTVRTRRPRASEWRLEDQEPRFIGDQVEIRFVDTGPGIPEDVRRRLFIPFFTTKEKGTGLGLAICQRIVKLHGGTLEVESRLGVGTTFILRLPTRPDPSHATPPPELREDDGASLTPVPQLRPAS